jgi:hypothetical protein
VGESKKVDDGEKRRPAIARERHKVAESTNLNHIMARSCGRFSSIVSSRNLCIDLLNQRFLPETDSSAEIPRYYLFFRVFPRRNPGQAINARHDAPAIEIIGDANQ